MEIRTLPMAVKPSTTVYCTAMGIKPSVYMRIARTATSMYSGVFNIGIGGGALVGSQTISILGLNYIGYIGGLFTGMALLTFVLFSYKIWLIRKEEQVAYIN